MNSSATRPNRAIAPLHDRLVHLARRAGSVIMEIYGADDVGARLKGDHSPLTNADLAANQIILETLNEESPEIPVITEESPSASASERESWDLVWLVDPLDGTKEFLKRSGEFTVNIAFINHGRPVAGVVHAPALGLTYFGQQDHGAVRHDERTGEIVRISTMRPPASPFRAVASRSHMSHETQTFLSSLGPHSLVSAGSSLKLCRVADGTADVYPRLAPTMEWDTAAGQAVLEAAGGIVLTEGGEPVHYNKRDLRNPSFIAAGDPTWLRARLERPI